MERQQVSGGSLPLEPSLTNLILNSKSEKIRRPPNAFMLFARDHRQAISKQHPDVSNKIVSIMLGKIWKSAAQNIKEKYYKDAKMLGELHKRRYPNYVYSPREARIQKMNKKKKQDAIISTDSLTQTEDVATPKKQAKHEDSSKDKDWVIDTSHDSKSSPEYVPNNPEYFTQQSPEMNQMEDSSLDLHPRSECPVEYEHQKKGPGETIEQEWTQTERDCGWQNTLGRSGCCNQNKLGCKGRCFPLYEKREREGMMPHLPCSYATPSPFCNAPGHYPGSMGSYYFGTRSCTSPVPRPYGSPFHKYWNPPLLNDKYYQSRDCCYDDLKQFPFPPSYHSPDFYRHPFTYFDRSASQLTMSPNPSFHPHLNGGLDLSQRAQDEFVTNNPESQTRFGKSDEKDSVHQSLECNSRNEETTLRNNQNLRSDVMNNEHLVNQCLFSKLENKPQETLSSHTYTPICGEGMYSSSRLQHQYRRGNQTHSCIKSSENKMKDVLSSVIPPDSSTHESSSQYVDNYFKASDSKLYKLPNFSTFEPTRLQPRSNTVMKPLYANNDIYGMFNKCTAKLDDRQISSPLENNTSVTYVDRPLTYMKTWNNFDSSVQNKDFSESTTKVNQETDVRPINMNYYKEQIQIKKEISKNVGFDDNHSEIINQKLPMNAYQPQFSRSVIKMETNSPKYFPTSEVNESNSVVVTNEQEALNSATMNQDEIDVLIEI